MATNARGTVTHTRGLHPQFDILAKHYVDYTGEMSQEQIAQMLHARARRTELDFFAYRQWCATAEKEALEKGTKLE